MDMSNYLDAEHYAVRQLIDTIQANEDRVSILRFVKETGARLVKEGNQWCYILGNMPENYVAGFGDSPYQAACEFQSEFYKPLIKPNETK